jgi:hypothetical protein
VTGYNFRYHRFSVNRGFHIVYKTNSLLHAGSVIIRLSIYWKKGSRLMRSSCSLCVSESLHINFWVPEPVFMELGMYMYIKTSESISGAYLINISHQSVCLYVYHAYTCLVKAWLNWSFLVLLGNCWVNSFLRQRTCNNRRIVRCVYLWVCLRICLSLLGNNSVKTFPQQRRIGDAVFYAVRVVSKEIRWLVLPRVSCF